MTVVLSSPAAPGPAPPGLPPEILAALAGGRPEEADRLAVSALARSPADPALLNLLGVIRIARGVPQEARRPLAQAEALAPHAAPPALNLALIFLSAGAEEPALRWARRARLLDPSLPDAHATEASAERANDNLDRAEHALRRAIGQAPSNADFLANAGNLRFDREELAEARRFFRRALAVLPSSGNPRFQLACLDLCEGNLARGWREYEARFIPVALTRRRPFPQPEWQGQDLPAGALLVWGEQGLGDELVFSTLLADVLERVPGIVVECDPRLVAPLARSVPRLAAYPRQTPPHPALLSPAITHQIALGSLPRLLRPTPASFDRRRTTLRPDPARVAASRAWLAGLGDGLKVGIAWRSGRKNAAARRIHTQLAEWEPILRTPGVVFVSLQYDDCADELDEARRRFGVRLHQHPDLDLFGDVDGALACSSLLDLAISTGTTSYAFPAIAGMETWMLTTVVDYLAMGERRYPWYPRTRCFVRPAGGDWRSTIAGTAEALRARTMGTPA